METYDIKNCGGMKRKQASSAAGFLSGKRGKMVSISLCMIVRDEEAVLGRCLESVRGLMDEMILVDTGSVDRTKEIAAEYTDRVYEFTWIDDLRPRVILLFPKRPGNIVCGWTRTM